MAGQGLFQGAAVRNSVALQRVSCYEFGLRKRHPGRYLAFEEGSQCAAFCQSVRGLHYLHSLYS